MPMMAMASYAAPAVYALIVCAQSKIPCEEQKASVASITREECIERLQLFRLSYPKRRLLCVSEETGEVIDTDELDRRDSGDDPDIGP